MCWCDFYDYVPWSLHSAQKKPYTRSAQREQKLFRIPHANLCAVPNLAFFFVFTYLLRITKCETSPVPSILTRKEVDGTLYLCNCLHPHFPRPVPSSSCPSSPYTHTRNCTNMAHFFFFFFFFLRTLEENKICVARFIGPLVVEGEKGRERKSLFIPFGIPFLARVCLSATVHRERGRRDVIYKPLGNGKQMYRSHMLTQFTGLKMSSSPLSLFLELSLWISSFQSGIPLWFVLGQ